MGLTTVRGYCAGCDDIVDVHQYIFFHKAVYVTTPKVLKSAQMVLNVDGGGNIVRIESSVRLSLYNQHLTPLHTRRNVVVHPSKSF